MPNVFGVADDILTAGFEKQGRDDDVTLDKELRICRYVNLKLDRYKFLFRCTRILFFGEITS